MIRTRSLAVSSLVFAAACAAGVSAAPPDGNPAPPGDAADPGDAGSPGLVDPPSPNEPAAVTLGMTILARDGAGSPRLMRSIVPRAGLAGMTPAGAARDHVAAIAQLWVKQAPAMTLIDRGTQQLRNGATVIKLAQAVDGIPVHDSELHVLLYADSSLAAVSGTLLPSIAKPRFVSSPSDALGHALDQLYGAQRAQAAITELGDRAGWQQLAVAAVPGMKITTARARRELIQLGTAIVPGWSLEVAGTAPADPLGDPSMPAITAHRLLVTDGEGRVVGDTDLVRSDAFTYRVFAEKLGNRRPFDGALADFSPHPTGLPDGSSPGFATTNLAVMDSFNQLFDKWLPDDASTTSGNNVTAFADLDGSGDFTPGDIRPEVHSRRVLSYTYDTSAGPLSAVDQSKAATVNSFFVTNWLHDWWYDSGFTEATGNAQADNYGRGGLDGDPLILHAQDGATAGSRNNAFMTTPDDGASPEMHMFLWTPGTATALTTPAGVIASFAFAAGPQTFNLTADIAAAVDATAPIGDACQPITSAVAGKIAVVTFSGVCGSLATVNNAKAAGAIGIILIDGALDVPRGFAGSAAANIPGLAIGKTDGAALLAALAIGPIRVTLSSEPNGPERDGDLDNTVVAHEWGHYLHLRLTSCGAAQCGGMSEGWGDFNALLLMLREGDHREGTYAMGPYATADGTFDSAYFGIRRFPYSIDHKKNDLRFRHIADASPLPTETPGGGGGPNSEVHNAGEVWASMLWEAYNILIDAHDVPTARRRMSDYVVAGLLMTPPNATFTEGRDAILAAASALDTDDMTLMAAAFAGRGAGSCAVSPSNEAAGNAGLVESDTLAAKLEVDSMTLIDDGVSCDHDGVLDPGESGQLRVTLANSGIVAAENVSVTASTGNAGVRLGAPIKLAAMVPFSSVELAIPVTVLASAPRNANITINLAITGDDTCDRNGVSVALHVMTGVDEAAAAARVDHVETAQTPWTVTGDNAGVWARAIEATGNHVWFGKNAGFPSDTQLVSPALITSTTEPFVVKLSHSYNLEGTPGTLFDGGVIEVSSDAGATWADVTTLGVDPGYSGILGTTGGNPLGGRAAFSGISPGFPARQLLTLNFGSKLAGKSVQLRFRIGTDLNTAASGWNIDDVDISGITNTPFPALVPEPSTCTARQAPLDASAVLASHGAPATSLRPFDSVCVLYNQP